MASKARAAQQTAKVNREKLGDALDELLLSVSLARWPAVRRVFITRREPQDLDYRTLSNAGPSERGSRWRWPDRRPFTVGRRLPVGYALSSLAIAALVARPKPSYRLRYVEAPPRD